MYRRHFDEEEDDEEDEGEERDAGVDNTAHKTPASSLLYMEDPDLINRNQQPALHTEPLDENNATTAAANKDNIQGNFTLGPCRPSSVCHVGQSQMQITVLLYSLANINQILICYSVMLTVL